MPSSYRPLGKEITSPANTPSDPPLPLLSSMVVPSASTSPKETALEPGRVYNYRFSTGELKQPIQDAVTSSGWTYRGIAFGKL